MIPIYRPTKNKIDRYLTLLDQSNIITEEDISLMEKRSIPRIMHFITGYRITGKVNLLCGGSSTLG